MTQDAMKTILNDWLRQIQYQDCVGYSFNFEEYILEIYTTKPGLLIGKNGLNIKKLKEILKREFVHNVDIQLTEIKGGFLFSTPIDDNNPWVSTKSKKPPKIGEYLVTRNGIVTTLHYNPNDYHSKVAWSDVSAWKQKPEAYKHKKGE